MSKVLYTKYRPKNFDEVIGQDVAVTILKRSIETNKINHAYLFYGIRGTGKTTLARIFAKAINCENNKDGNPCDQCESCKIFNKGASLDMIEIDAASHNGVDEMRELTEKANYSTSSAKYKVYIIDEVHMLSKSAFNALLKTLEEPPANTIFLFATTEINKIPDTIQSRTIILNLQLVPSSQIINHLEDILIKENKEFEKEAISYIADLSEGSVRDAISLLETTMLYSELISKSNVIKVLGVLDKELIRDIIKTSNIEDVEQIDETINGSRLMILFINELINMIKEGQNEYKYVLDKLTEGFLTIKDPILLNKFIRTTFISLKKGQKFTRSTLIEQSETKETSKESITNTIESENIHSEQVIKQETIETNTNNTNVSHETNNNVNNKENDFESEVNTEKEDVSRETNEKTIFDVVEMEMIVTEIMNANNSMLESIKNKWPLMESCDEVADYDIVKYLLRSKPVAVSQNAIFVGFHNEWMYEEFKKKTLSCDLPILFNRIANRDIVIIPVTVKNWKKLLLFAKKMKESNKTMDKFISPFDVFSCNEETTRDIAVELFGDKLIKND